MGGPWCDILGRMYRCDECARNFTSVKGHNIHQTRAHGAEPARLCLDCGVAVGARSTRCRRCNLVQRNTVTFDQAYVLARIEVNAEGCWIWQGTTSSLGYSRSAGGYSSVHQLAYALWKGPMPAGLEPDHLCKVRLCVNPDHLEAVTHRANSLRCSSPFADNARKTQCVRGHEFTPENIIPTPTGGRRCRTCHNARTRAYKQRARTSEQA